MGRQRHRSGLGTPPAAELAWPAWEACKGFCCWASVGRVSQGLGSSERPMRAGNLSLVCVGKQPQPKALGHNKAQAGAMVGTQVVSLWSRSPEIAQGGVLPGPGHSSGPGGDREPSAEKPRQEPSSHGRSGEGVASWVYTHWALGCGLIVFLPWELVPHPDLTASFFCQVKSFWIHFTSSRKPPLPFIWMGWGLCHAHIHPPSQH